MKITKSLVIALVLTVVLSALYRVIPNRPGGFAPQIAIALFSGAIFVKNKKWAFTLPLLSMFLSDLLYQLLYSYGLTDIQGFYSGQWVNYLLFSGLTLFGFFIRKNRISNILVGALTAPTAYFIVSNFLVWSGGGGLQRPKTMEGLMMCYADALPFYTNSLLATVIFAAILFGGYYFIYGRVAKKELV